MSDLRELYQEVILDHSRKPRNFRRVEPTTHHARGFNPLCGDKLELYLQVKDDRVQDVGFEGSGCAIFTASASMLTDIVRGKTVAEALELFEHFHAAVTTPPEQPIDSEDLGKLIALVGVREFPARVKCASLAWHTLDASLKGAESVTTE